VFRILIVLLYLAIGLVVASNNNYLGNLNDLSAIVSALLAVLLWPLVLLGIDVRIGDVPKVKIRDQGLAAWWARP
jgi:hypothetical protein